VTVAFQFETSHHAQAAYTLSGQFDGVKGVLSFEPENWIRKGELMTTVPIKITDAIYENGARLSTLSPQEVEEAGRVACLCGLVVHRSCGYICLTKEMGSKLPAPASGAPPSPTADEAALPDLVDADGAGIEGVDAGTSALAQGGGGGGGGGKKGSGRSIALKIVHKHLRAYAGYTPYSYKIGTPCILTVPEESTTNEVLDLVEAAAGATGADTSLPYSLIHASNTFDEARSVYGGNMVGQQVQRTADGETPERFWSVSDQVAATRHVTYSYQSDPRQVNLVIMWGQVPEATIFTGHKAKGVEEDGEAQESTDMTLQDCLELFRVTEKLSEEDAWFCPKCQEFKEATKKMDLWSTPELLCFHLKRFSMDVGSYWVDKLETPVDIPLEGLDMSSYVLRPGDVSTYTLAAVSNHYGGTGGGHYTAYARNEKNGRWYEFDDSRVAPMPEGYPLDRAAAYVAFYIRDDKIPESWKRRTQATPSPSDQDSEQDEDGRMSLQDEEGFSTAGEDAAGMV